MADLAEANQYIAGGGDSFKRGAQGKIERLVLAIRKPVRGVDARDDPALLRVLGQQRTGSHKVPQHQGTKHF